MPTLGPLLGQLAANAREQAALRQPVATCRQVTGAPPTPRGAVGAGNGSCNDAQAVIAVAAGLVVRSIELVGFGLDPWIEAAAAGAPPATRADPPRQGAPGQGTTRDEL